MLWGSKAGTNCGGDGDNGRQVRGAAAGKGAMEYMAVEPTTSRASLNNSLNERIVYFRRHWNY